MQEVLLTLISAALLLQDHPLGYVKEFLTDQNILLSSFPWNPQTIECLPIESLLLYLIMNSSCACNLCNKLTFMKWNQCQNAIWTNDVFDENFSVTTSNCRINSSVLRIGSVGRRITWLVFPILYEIVLWVYVIIVLI